MFKTKTFLMIALAILASVVNIKSAPIPQRGLTSVGVSEMKSHQVLTKRMVENISESAVKKEDSDGTTPLHLAIEKSLLFEVQRLILAGTNIDGVDFMGRTPLHMAIEKRNVKIFQVLVDAGANVTMKDYNESTPLHLAAEAGTVLMVEVLMNVPGINLDAQDSNGKTPLHLATHKGNYASVKMLIDKGANVEISDNENLTAFKIALKNYNREIARLLAEKSGFEIDDALFLDANGNPIHSRLVFQIPSDEIHNY